MRLRPCHRSYGVDSPTDDLSHSSRSDCGDGTGNVCARMSPPAIAGCPAIVLAKPLQRCILLSAHDLKGIHLRAQLHELDDSIAARRSFHLAYHRLVRGEIGLVVWIGGFEVGQVEVVIHLDHILVEIRRLDLIHVRVCVREEQV